MVNPKKEPGYMPQDEHQEHKKDDINRRDLRNRWRDRMKSKLLHMSRGAQNFWTSLPWPHSEGWRRNKKK
jgi:hypothetical protein